MLGRKYKPDDTGRLACQATALWEYKVMPCVYQVWIFVVLKYSFPCIFKYYVLCNWRVQSNVVVRMLLPLHELTQYTSTHIQSAQLYTFVFWYSFYMFQLSTAILRQFIALCLNHYILQCQFCNNVIPNCCTAMTHKSLNMYMQCKYTTPNCEIWFVLNSCSISILMLLIVFDCFISVHSPNSEFKFLMTWMISV